MEDAAVASGKECAPPDDLGTFDAEVKARVDRDQKIALDAIARRRQLRTADVVREALRFYLEHQHKLEAA